MRGIILMSLVLLSPFAHADQTLQLPAFNAVKCDGIFDIEITAGSTQLVVVKGSDDETAKLKFEVVNEELVISSPHNTHNMVFSTKTKIVITMPAVRLFKSKGVGDVVIKNVDGDRIDLSYDGVGSMEVSGKTKWLRLKGHGVGAIDTKKLLADNADVEFDGVGGVEIYVSNHLNAVVHGVGSMTYYGNPKSVNKVADGIGSVSSGN